MKTEKIQRKAHALTGEVTSFEAPKGWFEANKSLAEKQGFSLVAEMESVEVVKPKREIISKQKQVNDDEKFEENGEPVG